MSAPTHACGSQCDNCHTLEKCVEATRRLDELTLCGDCYLELTGTPPRLVPLLVTQR